MTTKSQAEKLHKLDRSHYDTPGSIRGCNCASCKKTREFYRNNKP